MNYTKGLWSWGFMISWLVGIFFFLIVLQVRGIFIENQILGIIFALITTLAIGYMFYNWLRLYHFYEEYKDKEFV